MDQRSSLKRRLAITVACSHCCNKSSGINLRNGAKPNITQHLGHKKQYYECSPNKKKKQSLKFVRHGDGRNSVQKYFHSYMVNAMPAACQVHFKITTKF